MANSQDEVLGEVNNNNNNKLAHEHPLALHTNRKSSFSDALTKFTTNTFNRRRTTVGLTDPSSSGQPSRLPTPSGITRSSSFFSSLNTFASKSNNPSNSKGTAGGADENSNPNQAASRSIKKSTTRKLSERLTSAPFFGHQNRVTTEPSELTRSKRDSSNTTTHAHKIEQRGLMQPVQPPIPRSSTMGNLSSQQQSSPRTPGFMRPTSSSEARRTSNVLQRQRTSPMPTIKAAETSGGADSKTPTPKTANRQMQRHRASDASSSYPARGDSLLPVPTKALTNRGQEGPKTSNLAISSHADAHNSEEGEQHPEARLVGKDGMKGAFTMGGNAIMFDEMEEAEQVVVRNTEQVVSEGQPVNEEQPIEEKKTTAGAEKIEEDDEEERIAHAPIPDIETFNPREVHDPMPAIWWLGRHTALSDRFRTAALPNSSTGTSIQAAYDDPMHDERLRNKRIFIHLRSMCKNQEVLDSLEEFKKVLEERERRMAAKAAGGGAGAGVAGGKGKEKKGFFDGLMGKNKGKGK